MFEALLVTLREGVEAALVVAIILVHLRGVGRADLGRWIYWGLGVAVAASVAGAALLDRVPLTGEAAEGTLMLVAAAFVASMVIWMWRTARGLKGRIEGKLHELTGRDGALGWGLFGLSFILLFREGVETVLFLAAVRLTTDGLLTALGAAAGVGLAVVFGVALVRGAVRIDIGRFFKVTGIVLLVFAAHLLVGAYHEFGEAGIVPIGREEMRIVGPIVKSQALVIASMLAIPLLLLLVPASRRPPAAPAADGPARRLQLAAERRERRWRTVAGLAGLVVIAALTVSMTAGRFPKTVDPPIMLTADAAGEVRVPLTGLGDGHLHRFGVDLDGVTVRFLIMKAGGTMRAAFDACMVCGAYGYVEREGKIVCLACAADINPATIGASGGCNPLPLPARFGATEAVIRTADLAAEREAFLAALSGHAAPPRN